MKKFIINKILYKNIPFVIFKKHCAAASCCDLIPVLLKPQNLSQNNL